jgi:hypothetical protein
MARISPIALLVILLSAVTPDAAAGGSWGTPPQLQGSYLPVGETLTFKTDQILFRSIEEAKVAEKDQGFHAYLVDGLDRRWVNQRMYKVKRPNWWRTGDASLINVGPLTVKNRNANLASVSADLNLTDVPPGVYHLMFCDLGCSRPLADSFPRAVTVVEDPVLARLANRQEDLLSRFSHVRFRLRSVARNYVDEENMSHAHADIRVIRDRVQESTADLSSDLREMNQRVISLEAENRGGPSLLSWFLLGGVIGGSLVGSLALLLRLLRSRRQRRLLEKELFDLSTTDDQKREKAGAGIL